MATNSVLEYKLDHLVKEEDDDDDEEHKEEEEEEEALSLCDLPVTLINDKDQQKPTKQDTQFGETDEQEENEDFNFNSWGGLLSEEPEMCAADEVFFQGQILPLRHSNSSEPCSSSTTKEFQIQRDGSNNKQFNGCESRESMDHGSTSEFGSNSNSSSSSRSGSLRSQNSSSSTSSTTTTPPPIRVSKPKIRNQFHTIPSPKPQLRQSRSGTRQTILNFSNQGRKSSSSSSSAWEFFRLGVAPAPEMLGLQDLKFRNGSANNRNCVSRNSSSSSSNNSSTTSNAKSSSVKKLSNNKSGGGLLSGCSCSVDSVVSHLDTVMIKSTTNKRTESVATSHAMKEKVVAKLKKHNNSNNRQKQQAKKVLSRRRTFEWRKELHAIRRPEDEEALLSSNT